MGGGVMVHRKAQENTNTENTSTEIRTNFRSVRTGIECRHPRPRDKLLCRGTRVVCGIEMLNCAAISVNGVSQRLSLTHSLPSTLPLTHTRTHMHTHAHIQSHARTHLLQSLRPKPT
jgi:hypothetical protein